MVLKKNVNDPNFGSVKVRCTIRTKTVDVGSDGGNR